MSEITAKTPWIKNLGDMPAHLEYFQGSMYDLISNVAAKYPDNIAFDFMGKSRADFIQEYGPGCVYINLGLHGLLLLAYMDGVILLTEGVGFTGPTLGVLLAALSFTAGGQHPKNVWPILAGFGLLWLAVFGLYALGDRSAPWTLSTQGYINGVALGTGLCPFAGCYGKRAGILAGVICAAICTSVSVIHGGLVLYNGGMSAGFTALILTPLLDHYYTGTPRS